MISALDERFIAAHAYVPEHLPGYVGAVSATEPHRVGDFLCYRGADRIVFIGYPLGCAFDESAMAASLETAVARFAPQSVSVVGPSSRAVGGLHLAYETDRYYRLDLETLRAEGGVAAMVRRATRDVQVEGTARVDAEHVRLIAEFVGERALSEETRYIFERVPAYVRAAATARVFSARDRSGRLVAFDVADFSADEYAFYLFNFRTRAGYVPGTSDLLLRDLALAARAESKHYLNLGLGISEGVTAFKRKWGATPFVDYAHCRYRPRRPRLLDALLRGR